jgi:hypothetical protein
MKMKMKMKCDQLDLNGCSLVDTPTYFYTLSY